MLRGLDTIKGCSDAIGSLARIRVHFAKCCDNAQRNDNALYDQMRKLHVNLSTLKATTSPPFAERGGVTTSEAASTSYSDKDRLRRSFTLVVSDEHHQWSLPTSKQDLLEHVLYLCEQALGIHLETWEVDTLYLLPPSGADQRSGRRRVFMRVTSGVAAESLVWARTKLKKSPDGQPPRTGLLAVKDFLSKEELETHRKLWPLYVQAKADGRQAFFRRERLFVDRSEVHVPG